MSYEGEYLTTLNQNIIKYLVNYNSHHIILY